MKVKFKSNVDIYDEEVVIKKGEVYEAEYSRGKATIHLKNNKLWTFQICDCKSIMDVI